MRRSEVVYRFGVFELDPASRRLTRAGTPVPLTDPQFRVLEHLLAHAQTVATREALANEGWGGPASDNSIEQVISTLRKVIADGNGGIVIETVRARGYRVVGRLEQIEPAPAFAAAAGDTEPIRTYLHGRRALATLTRDGIAAARRAFETTLQQHPDYGPAHIDLANACALAFEATRFDRACDLDALARALDHARRGVELEPGSADAWSALGFVLCLHGRMDDAAVAAWKAVTLEPAGWTHALRLAFVSAGDERVRAAHTALTLRPRLALAHWLKATVLITRGAFEPALIELREGCAAQDQQPLESALYPGVGLHLLHGLVLIAQDRPGEATCELNAELAGQRAGQLYSRECTANTWYAIGAIRLRQGDHAGARAAFGKALDAAPRHFVSMAALGLPLPSLEDTDPRAVNLGIARAVALVRAGRHREAAQIYREAVALAPAPNAGWILPVEPILQPSARPDVWGDVLTLIQQRAT